MHDIKGKLKILADSGVLASGNIVMFQFNSDTRTAASALMSMGIKIDGILSSDKRYAGKKVWGIDVYDFNSFYNKFKKSAFILLNQYDFKAFELWFNSHGYYKNKNLLVDYTYKFKEKIIKEENEITDSKVMSRCLSKIATVKPGIISLLSFFRGYKIYKNILKQYGYKDLFIYDYLGMGDAFVFGGYIKERYGKDVVISVIGNTCKRVLEMFGFTKVYVLTEQESMYLNRYIEFTGPYEHIFLITPIPQHVHTDITNFILGPNICMADAYRWFIFKDLMPQKFTYPDLKLTKEELEKIADDYCLSPEKSILLSPHANTVVGFPMYIWEKLAGKLSDMGFDVYTNVSGSEKIIRNTKPLSIKLEEAESIIGQMKAFVGLRSGFCDIICNASCKKIIIYPDMEKENFNSSVYNFCSFKKMNIGKNIREIRCKYANYDNLIERIVYAIDSEDI